MEFYKVKSIIKLLKDVETQIHQKYQFIEMECEVNQIKEYQWCLFVTLKDKTGDINGTILKRAYKTGLTDGDQIKLHGKIQVNKSRINIQILDYELSGIGEMFTRFLKIKKQLEKKGYFDQEKKRPISRGYNRIGLITSFQAAGFKDMLQTFKQRMISGTLFIYPTLVQGKQAPKQIANAIRLANKDQRAEILVIARGGGSKEDLDCFNDPVVADALYQSKIITITGIGHQIDVSIADLVADKYFITPTAAAEGITFDRHVLITRVQQMKQQLQTSVAYQLNSHIQQYQHKYHHLTQLKQMITTKHRSQLQKLMTHLIQSITSYFTNKQKEYQCYMLVLKMNNPLPSIVSYQEQFRQMVHNLQRLINGQIVHLEQRLENYQQQIEAYHQILTKELITVSVDDVRVFNTKEFKKRVGNSKTITIQFPDGNIKFPVPIKTIS